MSGFGKELHLLEEKKRYSVFTTNVRYILSSLTV